MELNKVKLQEFRHRINGGPKEWLEQIEKYGVVYREMSVNASLNMQLERIMIDSKKTAGDQEIFLLESTDGERWKVARLKFDASTTELTLPNEYEEA